MIPSKSPCALFGQDCQVSKLPGFVQGYLEEFPGYYNSGDSGVIDDNGYISVLERSSAAVGSRHAQHKLSHETLVRATVNILDS